MNPADSIPYVNLGNVLRDRNRRKEAEEVYRTALRLDTVDGRVYYDLGLVLAETNRPAEAEARFRKAVALEATGMDLLRALSHQLEQNGKREEARTVREQIVERERGGKEKAP